MSFASRIANSDFLVTEFQHKASTQPSSSSPPFGSKDARDHAQSQPCHLSLTWNKQRLRREMKRVLRPHVQTPALEIHLSTLVPVSCSQVQWPHFSNRTRCADFIRMQSSKHVTIAIVAANVVRIDREHFQTSAAQLMRLSRAIRITNSPSQPRGSSSTIEAEILWRVLGMGTGFLPRSTVQGLVFLAVRWKLCIVYGINDHIVSLFIDVNKMVHKSRLLHLDQPFSS